MNNFAANVINSIWGDGNFVLQNSDQNTINIQDVHLTQHIQYDAKSRTLKVQCPVCHTPASAKTREELNENVAFNCENCGKRFFENDLLEKNAVTYLNLVNGENLQFARLLHAVNHDLRTDDARAAFDRCFQNKEVFGKTPQIYEWGALTLFFATPIEETIHHSARKIIGYLEESQRLDPNSETYKQIAGSIATRYYDGVIAFLEKYKDEKPDFTHINRKIVSMTESEKTETNVQSIVQWYRQMFRYLKELETCHRIFPNEVFLKTAIQEFYGYGGVTWMERRFIGWSLFISQSKPSSFEKMIKGYIWDYHLLSGNSDGFYGNNELKPMELLTIIEKTIKEAYPNIQLPEIRVGSIGTIPITINASLRLYQIIFWVSIVILCFLLWKTEKFLSFILMILGIGVFLHFKDAHEENQVIQAKTYFKSG